MRSGERCKHLQTSAKDIEQTLDLIFNVLKTSLAFITRVVNQCQPILKGQLRSPIKGSQLKLPKLG